MAPKSPLVHRCAWCGDDPLYQAYHDDEWGVPSHDDRHLFEMLILEGAQAGLSWITVLRKRAHYRAVFDGFDPERIARYDDAKVAALLADAGIVRNRAKVAATIGNARAYLKLREEGRTLDALVWAFVDGRPVQNHWKSIKEAPASTPVSDAMSRELIKRGFKFVGTTICYAYMQAIGMVNDHTTDCFRHREVRGLLHP
jgi:DNA-3-methyladenine glycosylase I